MNHLVLPHPKGIKRSLIDSMGFFNPKRVYVAYSVYDKISPRVYKLMKVLEACKDIKFHVNILEHDALIDRSRSRLATDFLAQDKHDIILFLDEDIVFNPLSIVQLVRLIREKCLDIVGGSYVTKSELNPKFTFKAYDEEAEDIIFGKDGSVREVDYISTG